MMTASALLLLVLAARAAQATENVLCPDQSRCADGSTCCLLQSGRYGCCPYKLAQCCSDHLHCCPEGFRCLVSNGTCIRDIKARGPSQAALARLQETTHSSLSRTVECDDGTVCREGSTCCKIKAGSYGCCAFEDAVCCSNHESCCPNGHECASNGTCQQVSRTVAMAKKYPSTKFPVSRKVGMVQCPDETFCEDGTTCCPISENQYGCCPFENAVCCSDDVHCCPFGYQCRTSVGQCVRQKTWLPMAKKLPSRRIEPKIQATVQCPDQSYCPNFTTCCLLSAGHYGCCPFPNAVCCSDHEHCCPEGTRCRLSTGSCIEDTEAVPLAEVSPELTTASALSEANAVVCSDKTRCQDGQTCCQNKEGGYSCCPYENAVCCSDKESCCPHYYVCDVSTGLCSFGTQSTPMAKKLPALHLNDVANVTTSGRKSELVRCPDQTYCSDGSTCCLLSTGRYGCCPFAHAVCCSDHEHCCPENTRCQLSTGSCIRDSDAAPISRSQPHVLQVVEATRYNATNDVICPDKRHCADGATCCLIRQGGYGCCPLPNAVCCSDREHCCPHGYKCNIYTGTCTLAGDVVPMAKKLPAIYPVELVTNVSTGIENDVVCPDQSRCSDGSTCCHIPHGGYGCCPLPNAVCCSDNKTCCPHGYTCHVSTRTCTRGTEAVVPMAKKLPAIYPSELVTNGIENDVVCPDKKHCSDGSTCCQAEQGGYGCCPFPNAVCCSDNKTCCPQGFTCHVSSGTCTLGTDAVVPMAKKLPAFYPDEVTVNGELTECPDGSPCPAVATCCMLNTTRYGCCPFPNADCCSDREHCCPDGYRCDASGMCTKASTTVAATRMFPATESRGFSALRMRPAHTVRNATDDVVCPDGKHCSGSETCCLAESGGYGCCPLVAAVCCGDRKHCCPAGFTCSLRDNKCYPPGILCPDLSTCPFGTSCCPMSGARFGCCPYPLATCCADLVHCCPAGTICLAPLDICLLSSGTVTNATSLLSGTEVQAQRLLVSTGVENDVVCPDQRHCSDGSTCCHIQQGGYGCCPLPNAVCCSDNKTCCPHGYTCHVSSRTCTRGPEAVVPMARKLPAFYPDEVTVNGGYVKCPDRSYCPNETTCCPSSGGRYGCCPYSYAECCSDHIHCCPEGFRCKISTGSCVQDSKAVPVEQISESLRTQLQQPSNQSENGRCPDGSYCSSGSTCCISTSGRYGCCPYSYAECCSDHMHCCPEGFRCQISTGSCVRGSKVATMKEIFQYLPAPTEQSSIEDASFIQCPDGNYCASGSTCCISASGRYSCCPYSYAQCCSDHIHCCPEGYRCQISRGTCVRGSKTVLMKNTYSSLSVPIQKPTRDVPVWCPGNITYCPQGHTCCPLPSGDFGCCPHARAQCCDDLQHCCAEGYTCEPGVGCTKEASIVSRGQKYPAVAALIFEMLFSPNVVCPDQTSCPKGSTCCKLASGQYGCCPYEQADCCSDGVHCCPKGYRCNIRASRCERQEDDDVVPMLKKLPSIPAP